MRLSHYFSTATSVICFFILTGAMPGYPADENNGAEEINRIRKEVAQMRAERLRTRQDRDRDRQEQDAYELRTKAHLSAIQNETDSVGREIARERNGADSLRAQVAALLARQHQYELMQNLFRERIIDACDSFLTASRRLPPMAGVGLVSSLEFLRAELSGKTVENVEALQRLDQIIRELQEATMSVQDLQTSPPIPEIKTTADLLRLGGVFEAAADDKGTTAALWLGTDSKGSPRWTVVKNPATAAAIASAVSMRQGKALPAIVTLPIGPDAAPPGGASGGSR
jgi:hypothetical protein